MMSQPSVTTGVGDCMLAAWNLAMSLDMPGVELCHGIVRGRNTMKGETFWHAWVEYDGRCIDFSNGRRASVPKEVFYVLCAVSAFQVRRYDRWQAVAEGDRYGTVGPWPPA